MKTVRELDDEHADIGTHGDKEAEEIVFCLGEISVDVAHARADVAELGHAINEKSDIFAKFIFDVLERDISILDSIMKDGGDNGVFVHAPIFDDFHDCERMRNIRVSAFTELAFMGLGGEVNSFFDARIVFHGLH